jgi:hypothetical protein
MDVYVYPYKPIAYLPITKNASTTFTSVFKARGWELQQLDQIDDSYQVFGHFRDPIDRHFKGTAEFLIKDNLTHMIRDPDWQKIWMSAVMDMHSYPITWALGSRANKIHWIPISRKIPTNYLTHRYLMSHEIDMNLLNATWHNESSIEKQQLYLELRRLHNQTPYNQLSFFYDSDIVLWNKIVPYTDEDNVQYFVD